MAEERVLYDNWKSGSTFARGLTTSNAVPQNAYQATNMQVYSNGSLGVRPWLRRWADTGMPSDTYDLATDFKGLQWHPHDSSVNSKVPGYLVLVTTNSTNYALRYDIDGVTWLTTAFPIGHSTNPDPVIGALEGYSLVKAGGVSELISPARVIYDGTGYYSASSNTYTNLSGVTSVIGGFAPRLAVAYKARVYYLGDSTSPVSIVYSDPDDMDAFASAAQYFNIGITQGTGNVGVIGAYALRDALLFFTSQGKWFAMTGASPDVGTLREIGKGPVPAYTPGGVIFRNSVWYLGRYANDTGVIVATPQGMDSQTFNYIRPANDFGWDDTVVEPFRGLASDDIDALILPYVRLPSNVGGDGVQSIDYVNQAWGHSSYWNTTLDAGGRGGNPATDLEVGDFALAHDRYMFMVVDESNTDNGGSSGRPIIQLYSRDLFLDRPSGSSDTYSAKTEVVGGDTDQTHQSAGEVKLAAYTPTPGLQSRVRQVIVDFSYWKSGSEYADPIFTVEAITRGAGTDGVTNVTETQTISAITTSSAGLTARKTFNFGDTLPFGGQSLVELTGIQSIAIQRVTVVYETQNQVPRN